MINPHPVAHSSPLLPSTGWGSFTPVLDVPLSRLPPSGGFLLEK